MQGDAILGQKLAQRRKELGLRQQEVAKDVGISRPHLSNIERGNDMPGRQTLVGLAIALKLSLDAIASPGGAIQAGAAMAQSEDEALLLYAYRHLPTDESDGLLKLLLARARVDSPPTN